MRVPVVGLTCQTLPEPIARSSVNQSYIDAVVGAGAAPLLLPIGLRPEQLEAVYRTIDGLLLPGGEDVAPERYGESRHPALGQVDEERDDLELTAATWALRDGLPTLGVCRGIQVLAVAAGGTLWQDVPSQYETMLRHDVRDHGRDHLCHEIDVEPDSLLHASIGATHATVNSRHHQAVRGVPPGFRVTARARDGVIEAIESPSAGFVVGVQCHPEGMWQTTAPEFAGLFRAFADAAARHASIEARQAS